MLLAILCSIHIASANASDAEDIIAAGHEEVEVSAPVDEAADGHDETPDATGVTADDIDDPSPNAAEPVTRAHAAEAAELGEAADPSEAANRVDEDAMPVDGNADDSELSDDVPMVAGHQLPPADGLYMRFDADRSWGAGLVVETIGEVSDRLAWLLPAADPIMIGDISKRGGGYLFGHISHNVGVDADLGLFTHGQRQPLRGFVELAPSDLDLEATWILIRELLNTERVRFILLDRDHIAALRGYVLDEVGMPLELVDSIFPADDTDLPWEHPGVVRHADNHRSHLHVRFTYRHDS